MSVITTSAFAKALRPGLKKIWGEAYAEKDQQWKDLFPNVVSSDKNYEEYLGWSGLGLAPVKSEGAPVTYGSMQQGFVARLTNVSYALGFIITKEAREDNQYMQIAQARAKALGFSMRQTKETVAANIFNRAFDSNYTFWDGKEMCATDHVTKSGYTFRNELATAADLSEASLEQALIDINDFRDDRGLRIAIKGQKLIVPKELMFEACRILDSELQNDTANNAVNAISYKGMLAQGYASNNYLTDSDAWFIITDAPNGMTYQERMGAEFTDDNEFDTENAKFKAFERYAFGPIDVRGVFGTPGA
jgi:phage major head subunit gpT-like protein